MKKRAENTRIYKIKELQETEAAVYTSSAHYCKVYHFTKKRFYKKCFPVSFAEKEQQFCRTHASGCF